MTTAQRSAPRGKTVPDPKAATHGELVARAGAVAGDFAQSMAAAFDRVIGDNVVGGKTPGTHLLFLRYSEGRSRLDTDAAAFITRQGLKAKAIADWIEVSMLPKKGVYEGLRLSPSTLSRKDKDKPLDAAVTERLVRQSELMVKAAEVFGEGAATWMAKAHPLLGGSTPMDAATNEYGGTKVREILNAIEHGGVV